MQDGTLLRHYIFALVRASLLVFCSMITSFSVFLLLYLFWQGAVICGCDGINAAIPTARPSAITSEQAAKCDSRQYGRISCAGRDVDQKQCESQQCCFDMPGLVWAWTDTCFYPRTLPTSMACSTTASRRKDCGYPGISEAECKSRECCWDSSAPAYPTIWCHMPEPLNEVCTVDHVVRDGLPLRFRRQPPQAICAAIEYRNHYVTNFFGEPDPRIRETRERGLVRPAEHLIGIAEGFTRSTAARTIARNQHVHIDIQTPFWRGNTLYLNLQAQLTAPRRPGESTTIANVLVPAQLDIPDRYIRRALLHSLYFGVRVIIERYRH